MRTGAANLSQRAAAALVGLPEFAGIALALYSAGVD